MTGRSARHGAVLLVDDDVDLVESLKRMLESALDVQVATAHDAQEALELLRNAPVHVILSDYRMPGMDGVAFLAAARRMYPGVQLMLMTGHPLDEASPAGLGVDAFLDKPFHPFQMVNAVRDRLPANE